MAQRGSVFCWVVRWPRKTEDWVLGPTIEEDTRRRETQLGRWVMEDKKKEEGPRARGRAG